MKALMNQEQVSVSGHFLNINLMLGYEFSFKDFGIDFMATAGHGFAGNEMRYKSSANSDYVNLKFTQAFIFRLSVQAVFALSLF